MAVKDDSGTGDVSPYTGTTSDIYEFFDTLMRLAGLTLTLTLIMKLMVIQFVQACISAGFKIRFYYTITTTTGCIYKTYSIADMAT